MIKEDAIYIAKALQITTKLDVQLVDLSGNQFYQSTSYALPKFQDLPDTNQLLPILNQHHSNDYLHYNNAAQLEYLATGLFNDDNLAGACLVGPFISKAATIDSINQILLTTHLTVSERRQLTQFYNALPILNTSEINATGDLLVNLFSAPAIKAHAVQLLKPDQPLHAKTVQAINAENQQAIEKRYQLEADMMQLVATGNLDKISQFQQPLTQLISLFSSRVPNQPLRSGKNICFVNNTLCRIAAKQGGVHPVFLDSISEKFAVLIEKQNTIQGLKNLVLSMLRDYTQLVMDTSSANFSPIVKRAIDFILIHLGHQFSLADAARQLSTNPAYLSRKFKEETGLTFTEFTNHRRIKIAKDYLVNQQLSITDIAGLIGYNDLTYFTRVFKKQTGQTPLQYRKTSYSHS